MDHSGLLTPGQVIGFTGTNQIQDQEEKEIDNKTNRQCVTLYTKLHQQSQLYERRDSITRNRLHAESEQEASSDMNSVDAVMDKLFQACDSQGKGRVRVSDLVEYLTTIVDSQLHNGSAVESLITIMDPDNINAEIGSEEFHLGLRKWIEQMKSDKLMDITALSTREDSVTFDMSHTESMEASLDESAFEDKLSVSHLSGRLTDLQYQNRKLSEELKESQAIIDSKEEELSKLSRDLQNAKSEIKRLPELADLRHKIEAENEELREQVTALTKKLYTEKLKTSQAEEEKEQLTVQLDGHKTQLAKLTSDLNVAHKKQEELKLLLTKNKEKISQLKLACCGFDAQLTEKDEQIQELQACLRETKVINEDLKNQIQSLQGQLNEAQHELVSLKSSLDKTSNTATSPLLKEMANEIEEDAEQLKAVTSLEFPSSIHNELQELLNNSPNLPWPLSEKELKESVVTTPDLVSQVGNAINASQSIDEEVDICGKTDAHRAESADKGDNEQMKKKCGCDYHYDVSNEKLRLFVSLLKYFREDNQKLRRIVTKCCLVRKASDVLESDSPELSPDSQRESLSVKHEKIILQNQHHSESDKTEKKLQKYSEKLLQEITKLKRSNVKLTEELHKSELHICELDEKFKNTQTNLTKERQHSAELEESLYNSTLARQLDLKDIWRLVQKDVETECEDLQEDSLNISTSDQLKEKIREEVEALRSQLQRREAALGSLKNNNLNFDLTVNYDSTYQTSNWYKGLRLSPTSPLVDALSIDMFNGNLPMYQTNYPYPSAMVSCEDVDCYECRAARLFLQSRFATSCPSIVPSKVGSNLAQGLKSNVQNGENEMNSENDHPEIRAGSTEITENDNFSGSNLLKRKRSLYGKCRRQDFIKSSGRGIKCQTQQCSPTSQQSELHTTSRTFHKDSQLTASNSIKAEDQSVSNNNNTKNNSNNDVLSNIYSPVQNEPTLGVRRTSFKLAVEGIQEESQFTTNNASALPIKDDSSFIEELRRPSFHAAIEQSRGDYPALTSISKRKVVQIASPEITESRAVTIQNSSYNSDNISSFDSTRAVKFYIDEAEPDLYTGVYPGSVAAWSSAAQNNNAYAVAATFPSSQISGLMAASSYSSSSSYSLHEDLSHRVSLDPRYSKEKEQTDISNKRESIQDRVLSSESSRTWSSSQAGTIQNHSNTKDVISGQNIRHGKTHSSIEYRLKGQEAQPSINNNATNSLKPIRKDGLIIAPKAKLLPSSSSTLTAPPANYIAPARTLAPNHVLENTRESTQTGTKRSPVGGQIFNDSPVTEVRTPSGDTVTLAGSPVSRCPPPIIHGTQPQPPSKLSQIRQSHLASKKREQMKARSMKLPELSESCELEAKPQPLPPTTTTDGPMTMLQLNTHRDMPQISITDEDVDVPPAPSDVVITPSLPDSFLNKLGLSVTNSSNGDNINQISIDQLPEKDIESKFASLSLAIKTDRLTLDRRLSMQERSRNLAEQNVDIELQGLRTAVETLTELVTDAQLRGLLQKIKLHINVLEQATARVSSRAEVFGAVQQEKRLCRAMEIMVLYTENLRRIREKEESDLHEARKILSERSSNGLSIDTESATNRRSLSASGYNSGGRMMRRRSEVVLPRVIGGVGSPPLTQSAVLDSVPPFPGHSNSYSTSLESEEGEDPKSRFQSAVASTSMQNVVTTTMRQCSLEKLNSPLLPSSFSPSYLSSTSSSILSIKVPTSGSVSEHRGDQMGVSKDEEAFRKGFEEGLKAKLSHELGDLRDQQNTISESLEHMMERVEQSQLEDEEYFSRPSRLEATLTLASTVGGQILQHDWRSNKRLIRNLAGVFFVFLAVFVVFFCPPISTVDVKHFTTPPQ